MARTILYGRYTIGEAGDYADWGDFFDEIHADPTGHIEAVQISDITQSGVASIPSGVVKWWQTGTVPASYGTDSHLHLRNSGSFVTTFVLNNENGFDLFFSPKTLTKTDASPPYPIEIQASPRVKVEGLNFVLDQSSTGSGVVFNIRRWPYIPDVAQATGGPDYSAGYLQYGYSAYSYGTATVSGDYHEGWATPPTGSIVFNDLIISGLYIDCNDVAHYGAASVVASTSHTYPSGGYNYPPGTDSDWYYWASGSYERYGTWGQFELAKGFRAVKLMDYEKVRENWDYVIPTYEVTPDSNTGEQVCFMLSGVPAFNHEKQEGKIIWDWKYGYGLTFGTAAEYSSIPVGGSGLPEALNNIHASGLGVANGAFYRTPNGTLMVRY